MTKDELSIIRAQLASSDDCSKDVIVYAATHLLEEVDRLNEVIRRTVKEDNDYINLLRERCAPKGTS